MRTKTAAPDYHAEYSKGTRSWWVFLGDDPICEAQSKAIAKEITGSLNDRRKGGGK